MTAELTAAKSKRPRYTPPQPEKIRIAAAVHEKIMMQIGVDFAVDFADFASWLAAACKSRCK